MEQHLTMRITRLLLLNVFVIFAGQGVVPDAQGQSSTPVMTQEYFIQQAADEDLLITIRIKDNR